jgi:hypothetical protein
MQLRSGKIIQTIPTTSEFKDNHVKLRPDRKSVV